MVKKCINTELFAELSVLFRGDVRGGEQKEQLIKTALRRSSLY